MGSLRSTCGICKGRKEAEKMFSIETGCSHAFCSDCVRRHVDKQLDGNVKCPKEGCKVVLTLESCRQILPETVARKWERALCSAAIPESEKYYCPYKDCSALLIKDHDIRYCECEECHRHICAKCSVPWHAGKSCEEFQTVKEDVEVLQLAEKEQSKRCPKCGFYVERTCGICMETKEAEKMFSIGTGCSHAFCLECVSMHVQNQLRDNVTTIKCPGEGCKVVLTLESCRQILPDKVAGKWDRALCSAAIPESEKYYCPYKDCSALLIKDHDIRDCECEECHRHICAKCSVPWHAGKSCKEFQTEKKDDEVLQLAEKEKWKRCPDCGILVEKTQGCIHVTCRCKCEFCYRCGSKWNEAHGVCEEK